MKLEPLNASCTEVWLKVLVQPSVQPRNVTLRRFSSAQPGDTVTVLSTTLASAETLIVDESLLPSRSYTYILICPASLFGDRSTASVRTLDTTSHEFAWEIDTLGDGNSSMLHDIAIINDTLAYAVGEIYLRDSTGQIDPLLYNLARWNGQRWEIKRVAVMFQGHPVTVPLEGIFTHSANDIWVAGSIPIHGDGINWVGYDIQALVGAGATVSRLWGTPSEMYFVGRTGNIIHYDGTGWRRLESGTTVTLNDVWGGSNVWVGDNVVLVAAGNEFQAGEIKLLRIQTSGLVDTIGWPSQTHLIHSVWFTSQTRIYTAGGGVWSYFGWGRWREQTLPPTFTGSIRGKGPSDIVVGGDFGMVAHYNGASWRVYEDLTGTAHYTSVAMNNNLVIAVGFRGGVGGQGIAAIGRR